MIEKHIRQLLDIVEEKSEDQTPKQLNESTGATDYNPKSQGGTRKELLAKYRKTNDPKDAEAARKAGATQQELQQAGKEGVAEGLKVKTAKGYGDIVQGTDVKTVAKADLGKSKLNLPKGYGDVVQPQKLKTVAKAKGVAEGEGTDLIDYVTTLKKIQAEKRNRFLELQRQGMSDNKAFSTAEREYGEKYKKLLSDMPDAHKEYVDLRLKDLWQGSNWQRDELSGRSAVDESYKQSKSLIKQGIIKSKRK